MTDYQYATALLEPDGTVWDVYPDEQGYTGGMAEAVRHATEWNAEHPDSDRSCVVVRREIPQPPPKWSVVVNPTPGSGIPD